MKSESKILPAAVAAAVLLTTLAVARTVHTPASTGEHAVATHGKVTGTNPVATQGSRPHGIITCGPATSAQDCDRLETLLPMHWSRPQTAVKPVSI